MPVPATADSMRLSAKVYSPVWSDPLPTTTTTMIEEVEPTRSLPGRILTQDIPNSPSDSSVVTGNQRPALGARSSCIDK